MTAEEDITLTGPAEMPDHHDLMTEEELIDFLRIREVTKAEDAAGFPPRAEWLEQQKVDQPDSKALEAKDTTQ